MKRHWLLYLTVAIVLGLGIAAVGCGDTEEEARRNMGEEVGIYYCSADTEEYVMNVSDDYKFTLVKGAENKTGTYEVKDGNVTFKFNDGSADTMTARYEDNTLNVTYTGNVQMTFYKRIKYNVSFNSDGGSSVAATTVWNGNSVAKPADPTRDGYTFLGWYEDEACKTPFLFGTQRVTGNTTVYAKWAAVVPGLTEYKISFDLGYAGEEIAARDTIGGKVYNVPETLERDGYSFLGWGISMTEERDKITSMYKEDTTFTASTTLYALWEEKTTGGKLSAPAVSVSENGVSWTGEVNAQTYQYEITGPSGFAVLSGVTGQTSIPEVDFANSPAGEYRITVKAIAASATNNSETTVRYYTNKALDRVSLFTVVEPATLLFNAVDNAEAYYINIECGDAGHNHSAWYNGTSTNYNFANCAMQPDGIKFTVTAKATGYADSVSKTFVYVRTLDSIQGLYVDEKTMTVKWSPVANATNYIIQINNGEDRIDNGAKTSYSLKECDAGSVVINVYPQTKGYNSPAATTLTYTKKAIAAPKGVTVAGDRITWTGSTAATSYTVKVGNKTFDVNTNEIALEDIAGAVDFVAGNDYAVTVMAKGATDSPWSDAVTFRYNAVFDSIRYNAGTVSWNAVVGAESYKVYINDTLFTTTTDTSVKVELNKAGNNKIAVSYFDGADESAKVETNVYAYKVDFDSSLGSPVAAQYYAVGDKLDLPTKNDTTKIGYTFAGWYNTPGGAAGNGSIVDDGYFYSASDVTLYANWTPNDYKVTFNYGADAKVDTTLPGSTFIAYDSNDYRMPVPESADGYGSFAGWYTQPAGMGVRLSDGRGTALVAWTYNYESEAYAYFIPATLTYTYDKATTSYIIKANYTNINKVSTVTVPTHYDDGVNGDHPVSTIEVNAFVNCSTLTTINIPNSITLINTLNTKYSSQASFYGASALENINIYEVEGVVDPKYYSVDGVLYQNNAAAGRKELAYVPHGRTGKLVIDDNCTAIPMYTFLSTKITEVEVPASVVALDEGAFYSARSLTTVKFLEPEEGVTAQPLTIQNNAFESCGELLNITFPARYTEYQSSLFESCSKLTNIFVNANNTKLEDRSGILYDKQTNTLLRYPNGRSGAVTIPQNTVAIGDRAFKSCSGVTAVTIPAWVASIGVEAFNQCYYLTSVTFNGSEVGAVELEIGEMAFANGWRLETVTFAENSNVVAIGEKAFYRCRVLETITFPGTMKEIASESFAECAALEEVHFADESEKELAIGDNAFSGCTSLTDIFIPKYITEISDGIFGGCTALLRLTVDADNPNYMTEDGVLFDKLKTEIKFFPMGKGGTYTVPGTVTKIGARVFEGNPNLEAIVIGENLTTIGDYAFSKATALTTVTVSATGGEIAVGKFGFSGCTALTTVNFNGRVKDYSDHIFSMTTSLTTVDLTGATRIGVRAFSYPAETGYSSAERASGIRNLIVPVTVTSIGYQAFYACTDLVTIHFQTLAEAQAAGSTLTADDIGTLDFEVNTIGNYTSPYTGYIFQGCTSLTTVEADRWSSLPIWAFAECSSLESFTVPATVKTVDKGVFNRCKALSSVTFANDPALTDGNGDPLTLTIVEPGTGTYDKLFYGCSALTSVTLPARLVSIPKYMFSGSKITSITIPENVRNDGSLLAVEEYAFQDIKTLTTVTFADPDTPVDGYVVSLAKNAFSGCSALTTVTFPKRLAATAFDKGFGDIFNNCNKLSVINIPDDCTTFCTDEQGLIYNSDKTTLIYCPLGKTGTITIPKTVTLIDNKAIFGTRYLTGIEFENGGVGEILADLTIGRAGATANTQAIADTGLTEMHLPARLKTISYGAFYSTNAGKNSIKTVVFDNIADSRLEIISGFAFANFSLLDKIVLPSTVKNLAVSAFQNDYNLKAVTFYNDTSALTTMGNDVFQNAGIKSFVIPSTVTSIGTTIFKNSALEEITVPDNITNLTNILTGAKYIKAVNIYTGSAVYDKRAGILFSDDGKTLYFYSPELTDIEYTTPDGVETIGPYAFYGNKNLRTVTIGASVKAVGTYAFANTNIQTVTVQGDNDDELAPSCSFGNYAFAESGVVTATFATRVNNIGDYAFSKTYSLKKVVFGPNSRVEAFGTRAFEYSSVCEIVWPSRLRTIGSYTFTNCSNLGYDADEDRVIPIVLPNTITALNPGSFRYTGIRELDMSGISVLDISWAYLADSCPELYLVKLPANVTTLSGNNLFSNCPKLTSIDFPESLIYLGKSDISSGGSLFDGTGLTTVTLPATIKAIAAGAFRNTPIETIVFEEGFGSASGFVIGHAVFEGTNVTSVTIPSTMAKYTTTAPGGNYYDPSTGKYSTPSSSTKSYNAIGMFNGCKQLETVVINLPSTATSLSAYMFSYCPKLTSVTINGGKLTSLGVGIFRGCTALQSVELPSTLTSFGNFMFADSGIQSVSIPANVTTTGTNTFQGCLDLTEVEITGTKLGTIGDYAFEGCTALTEINISKVTTGGSIGKYAFSGCTGLEAVVFNGKTINEGAFQNCVNLESVALTQNARNIYQRAFEGCVSIRNIDFDNSWIKFDEENKMLYHAIKNSDNTVHHVLIEVGKDCPKVFTVPSDITSIQAYAFANTDVEEIIVPATVTAVANYAFANCPKLKKVTFEAGSPIQHLGGTVTVGAGAAVSVAAGSATTSSYLFANCPVLEEVVLPDGLLGITGYMFDGCAALESIDLSEMTYIYTAAFRGAGLKNVYIPASITSIDKSVFENCVDLQTVVFDEDSSLTYIGNAAGTTATSVFRGCTSLTNVTLPVRLLGINGNLFDGCTSLASITIPETVDYIGANAFLGCVALNNVVLPSATAFIGANAFQNCTSLTSIAFPAGLGTKATGQTTDGTLGNYAFAGCSALETVTFDPAMLIYGLPNYVFADCVKLKTIVLPASIMTIGEGAFRNCTALTSVTLSEATSTIGKLAFEGCTAITALTITSRVYTVGADAFSGWTSAQTITSNASVEFKWDAAWNNECEATVNFVTTPAQQDPSQQQGE